MKLSEIGRALEEKIERIASVSRLYGDLDESLAAVRTRELLWTAERAADDLSLLKKALDDLEIKYEESSDAAPTVVCRPVIDQYRA